jgi:hypothetical protein
METCRQSVSAIVGLEFKNLQKDLEAPQAALQRVELAEEDFFE